MALSSSKLQVPLTSNTSTQKLKPGTEVWDADNQKLYVYARYSGTAAASNGTVVYHYLSANKVVDDISASEKRVAGVAVGAVTLQYYAFFQKKGAHTAVKKSTSFAISDGGFLFGGSDSKCFFTSTTAAPLASEVLAGMGIATEATGATSTTTAAILDCP